MSEINWYSSEPDLQKRFLGYKELIFLQDLLKNQVK